MSTTPPRKTGSNQEVAYHCVPVSAAEAGANFRLCVAIRDEADPATGHLFVLQQTRGARAVLGTICDAGGNVREWLELWLQDIDSSPEGETLVPSNVARDKAWEQ